MFLINCEDSVSMITVQASSFVKLPQHRQYQSEYSNLVAVLSMCPSHHLKVSKEMANAADGYLSTGVYGAMFEGIRLMLTTERVAGEGQGEGREERGEGRGGI